MRSTDCVAAHFFKHHNLTVDCLIFLHSAKCALVVVKAHTLKLHKLAVQAEAFVCIPVDITVTERGVVFVNKLACFIFNNSLELIKIGRIQTPQFRRIHFGFKVNRILRQGRNCDER